MSAQNLGVFELLDRLSGSFVDATLFRPIADRHVADFARLWKPCFAKAGVARSRRADDASWTWDQQVAERQGQLEWTSFAIEANGATQGLMFAKLGGFARERSQAGRPLVLVDRVATAPWNRSAVSSKPRFRGVGHLLMAAAVSLSFEEEFEGRVGLHALPPAETFYRDVCGMTDLGIDATRLRYFEMTGPEARRFLAQGT